MNEQGKSVHESKEMAETFSLQCEGVFSQPVRKKKIQNAPKCFQNLGKHKPKLTDFIFSRVEIEKAIDKLSSMEPISCQVSRYLRK